MRSDEHPDQAWERHQALADEDLARERRADRRGDYTPVPPITSREAPPSPAATPG